jgi:hypothetical protein
MALDILLKHLNLTGVEPVLADLLPIAEREGWSLTA